MNSSQISEAHKLVEEIRSKGTMKVKACTKCNRLKPESAFCKIAANKDGLHYVCKECDRKRSAQYAKTDKGHANLKNWMKQKDDEGYYRYGQGAIAKLRYGAKKRGIPFSLTPEFLEEWWINTPDICCYCNLPIEEFIKIRDFIQNYLGTNNNILKFKRFFGKGSYANIRWMTIDRKDNRKGYEIDNIAKACWFCNSLKGDIYSEEQFKKIGPQIISDLKKEISKELALSRYNDFEKENRNYVSE
jgi:RNase P subunit RPR2